MSDEKTVSESRKSFLVFLRALTPVHAGVGSEVMSPIDLPIQREKHTGWPTIYGSSLKGALRAFFEMWKQMSPEGGLDDRTINTIFGPSDDSKKKFVGLYTFTDAKVLFFPVRSYSHVYIYVTCPMALQRFLEDLEIVEDPEDEKKEAEKPDRSNDMEPEPVFVLDQKIMAFRRTFTLEEERKVEYYLPQNEEVGNAEKSLKRVLERLPNELQELLSGRLIIIDDTAFTSIVRTQTVIMPRIRLGPTKTTEEGNLWYEEYLPPETIMYFLMIPTPLSKEGLKEILGEDILKELRELEKKIEEILGPKEINDEDKDPRRVVSLGGKETIGKGLVILYLPNLSDKKGGEESGEGNSS